MNYDDRMAKYFSAWMWGKPIPMNVEGFEILFKNFIRDYKKVMVEDTPPTSTAPPLGIIPKYLHDEKRFNEIAKAIYNYSLQGLQIPIEWVQEYNELFKSNQ